MCHRHYQLDMTATLAAHLLLCYLHTTTVADDALVTDALVLSAGALIVACRTEDALAEETVALRLVGAVVDGLRLCHLAVRVLQNLLGRSKSDGDLREISLYFCIFLESHMFLLFRDVRINRV